MKKQSTRIRFVFIITILFLIIIILKVFYIQVIDYKKLNKLSSSLWGRNLPIAAERGKIYDRNGKVLADNITTTSLVLIPNQIKNKKEVSKKLAEILNVSVKEMQKHVYKKTSIERVHPEGRKLSYDVAQQIDKLEYDGVYLVKESKRYYPYKELLAHTLGYVGIDNQGLSGLELEYNKYLTGKDGAIKYFSDGKGKKLELSEVYVQPQNGIDVNLTIDLEIQKSIERELTNVVEKYNPDHALIMAMDPNTGEILGMGSRPSFNPNNYQNYSTEIINRNLPIFMTYEPGSTFKIITLTAAIEENKVNLFKDRYTDTGGVTINGARIKCWKAGGHGDQSYLEVVENSCNPGFVNLGLKLGKKTLFSYINKFGFGNKTGVDLNGEENGILFNLNKVTDLELATTAFGQGISVTPIQQITAVSSIVNGGTLYKPYITKSFSTSSNIIKENTPVSRGKVISKKTAKLVRYALENVVAHGSGRGAYIENYRIGGKTGTAQKVSNGAYMVGNYILSFIGFAPADNPKVVLYVAVDNPKGVTQYGGVVSAPIAGSIFKDLIKIMNIKESKKGIEKEYNWNDVKYIKVPDVTGKTKDEALKLLKDFKVEFSGSGNTVVYQSPIENNLAPINSIVKILLN